MSEAKYTGVICRGAYALGTACGKCSKCKAEWERLSQSLKSQTQWDKIKKQSSFLKDELIQVSIVDEYVKELQSKLAAKEQSLANANNQIERMREQIHELKTETEKLRSCAQDYHTKYLDTKHFYEAKVDELEEANRWIPVSERLPDDESVTPMIMFFVPYTGKIYTGSYNDVQKEFAYTEGACMYSFRGCVTHWKPITPPKAIAN